MNKTYIAIDLKSFYASVECVERGWSSTNVSQGFYGEYGIIKLSQV